MDVSKYVAQLREDLASAAAAGDEQTRTTAGLLGAAIEPAARLAIINALSDFAAEVSDALGDRRVELRLDGREIKVAVTGERPEPEGRPHAPPPPPPPPGPEGGDISRITLRLVEQIKAQAEQAAAQQGVSLNSWVAQAVQGALQGRQMRGPWEHGHGWQGERGRRNRRDDDGGDGHLRGWVQG